MPRGQLLGYIDLGHTAVMYGVVFVVCVLTFREGIVGRLSRALGRPR